MKNVKKLTVLQVRIFPNDYIPYDYLLRPDFIDHMMKKFHFKKYEMPFEQFQKGMPQILNFNGGDITFESNKILIKKLNFEDRRVVIEAMTSSKITTKIFDVVANEIKKFEPTKSFKRKDAVLETEETSCVANLNVDYKKIYSESFLKFLKNNFIPLIKHKSLSIRPKNLSFEIYFDPDNEYSRKHSITLVPKTFTIEPRAGHLLDEKLFFSHSPFDSDTHFKLLETFEKTFSI